MCLVTTQNCITTTSKPDAVHFDITANYPVLWPGVAMATVSVVQLFGGHTECWWGMALAGGTPYRPLRCEEWLCKWSDKQADQGGARTHTFPDTLTQADPGGIFRGMKSQWITLCEAHRFILAHSVSCCSARDAGNECRLCFTRTLTHLWGVLRWW